jgi:hypothetical protein
MFNWVLSGFSKADVLSLLGVHGRLLLIEDSEAEDATWFLRRQTSSRTNRTDASTRKQSKMINCRWACQAERMSDSSYQQVGLRREKG